MNLSICLFVLCCLISTFKNKLLFSSHLCNINKPWNRSSRFFFPSGLEQFSGSKDTDPWTYNVFMLLLFICTILVSRNLNHRPNFYCSRTFRCRLKNEHFCKELSAEIVGSGTLSCITELPGLGFGSIFGLRMGMQVAAPVDEDPINIISGSWSSLITDPYKRAPEPLLFTLSWMGTCLPPVRQQNTSKVFEI